MNAGVDYDVVVVGGGPTGLIASLGLAATGWHVAVCGQSTPTSGRPRDTRTAALFNASIAILENLGVWTSMAPQSAPLRAIRLVDSIGQLARGPEVIFRATDVGLEQLGWNVPNAALVEALTMAAQSHDSSHGSRLSCIEADVAAVEPGTDAVCVRLVNGDQILAKLVVGADGRRSVARQGAGIAVRSWRYDQAALTATFAHSRPHHEISTEFHRRCGPFTVVPMPGQRSSLVWVERPTPAKQYIALEEDAFLAHLEEHLQGLLGGLSDLGPRQIFPLSSLVAERAAGHRVALVGEAAHAFPPIGAQGLNLGFRDVATLVDCVAVAAAEGRDIGGGDLEAYAAQRARDIELRTAGVDVLNRTLTSALLPVDVMRGAVLHAVNALPALKRAFIAVGIAPPGQLPRLMQARGAAMAV